MLSFWYLCVLFVVFIFERSLTSQLVRGESQPLPEKVKGACWVQCTSESSYTNRCTSNRSWKEPMFLGEIKHFSHGGIWCDNFSAEKRFFSWAPLVQPSNIWLLSAVGMDTISIHSRVKWLCSRPVFYWSRLRSAVIETWHLGENANLARQRGERERETFFGIEHDAPVEKNSKAYFSGNGKGVNRLFYF